MTNTPEVDAMILPVPGRDVVTGQPIDVVHADDARVLERQRDNARTQIAAFLLIQKGSAFERDALRSQVKALRDQLSMAAKHLELCATHAGIGNPLKNDVREVAESARAMLANIGDGA